MNDFIASNEYGVREVVEPDAGLQLLWKDRTVARESAVSSSQVQALREFFEAEADERIGRWRWAANPDYVVYPDRLNTTPPSGAIRVWNERTGVSRYYLNRDGVDGVGGQFDPAAAAYFDAHPEPKPWTRAKAGELWFLTITSLGPETRLRWEAQGEPVRFWSGGLHIDARSGDITAGRQVNAEASA
ncbi:hypothetical protein ACFZA2_01985 [Microbacterium sp. NPDC007973]|uniref:hypothetical protein n=1 Tax=Microbacterium sp. NPDC007973 TaxID=3364182 RepID=UPI0036E9EF25